MMGQYPLRNVDGELWRAARSRAVEEGFSIRDVLVAALAVYVKKGPDALGLKLPKKKTA